MKNGSEEDWLERFEACTLPAAELGHRRHLRVAWTYLRGVPFEEGAPRFVKALKRFATHHGAPGKYHATITWALLALVAEAIDAHPNLDFDALLATRPELLDAERTLRALYEPHILDSDRARRVPLLPRRAHALELQGEERMARRTVS